MMDVTKPTLLYNIFALMICNMLSKTEKKFKFQSMIFPNGTICKNQRQFNTFIVTRPLMFSHHKLLSSYFYILLRLYNQIKFGFSTDV
jgi:hypothetical protein